VGLELDVGDHGAVREDRGLRPARGPAGEDQLDRVVLVDLDVGQLRDPGHRDVRPVALDDHDRCTDFGVLQAFVSLLVDDEEMWRRDVERVAHLGARPPAVHGHEDGVHERARPERADPLRTVRGADRHPAALPDVVPVAQAGRDLPDLLDQARERLSPTVGPDVQIVVAVGLRAMEQLVAQIGVAVLEHGHPDPEDLFVDDLVLLAGLGQRGVGLEDLPQAGVTPQQVRHRASPRRWSSRSIPRSRGAPESTSKTSRYSRNRSSRIPGSSPKSVARYRWTPYLPCGRCSTCSVIARSASSDSSRPIWSYNVRTIARGSRTSWPYATCTVASSPGCLAASATRPTAHRVMTS